MFVTIFKRGFEIPGINFDAFKSNAIGTTFGGYARILALMTGVEVFANMVAAYDGEPAQRSRKAFNDNNGNNWYDNVNCWSSYT